MRLGIPVSVAILGVLLPALVGVAAVNTNAPRVLRSTGGMEGLTEVAVQVHVAGDADWRVLVDMDEEKLARGIEERLRGVPGLRVVGADASEQTPRVLVIAVGHLIAGPGGNKDTVATSLTMNLNQPVSLRRPLPGGKVTLLTAITWQRSVLLTGVKKTMRERVADKLTKLAGEFKADHARANGSSQQAAPG